MWRSVGSQIQFQALKRRFFQLETKISCVYPHNWFKYEQLMALIWPLPNLYRLWKLWEESRGKLGLDTQSIFVTQNWEVPENRRWKMDFFSQIELALYFSCWIGGVLSIIRWILFEFILIKKYVRRSRVLDFLFFLQIGSQDNLFVEDVFKSKSKSGIKRSF